MNNEAMIQQHAAEIARHAKAIQELQAPKPDRTLDYIMLNGACRIHHAVASVIDRHAQLWRLEQMSMLLKTEEVLSRMEPDPWASLRDMWWTNAQMDRLRRPSNFRTRNVMRAMARDLENQSMVQRTELVANVFPSQFGRPSDITSYGELWKI